MNSIDRQVRRALSFDARNIGTIRCPRCGRPRARRQRRPRTFIDHLFRPRLWCPAADAETGLMLGTSDGAIADDCDESCCPPAVPPCTGCEACKCKTTPIRVQLDVEGIDPAINRDVPYCQSAISCLNSVNTFRETVHGNPNKRFILLRIGPCAWQLIDTSVYVEFNTQPVIPWLGLNAVAYGDDWIVRLGFSNDPQMLLFHGRVRRQGSTKAACDQPIAITNEISSFGCFCPANDPAYGPSLAVGRSGTIALTPLEICRAEPCGMCERCPDPGGLTPCVTDCAAYRFDLTNGGAAEGTAGFVKFEVTSFFGAQCVGHQLDGSPGLSLLNTVCGEPPSGCDVLPEPKFGWKVRVRNDYGAGEVVGSWCSCATANGSPSRNIADWTKLEDSFPSGISITAITGIGCA
jgi:hypothetical protein